MRNRWTLQLFGGGVSLLFATAIATGDGPGEMCTTGDELKEIPGSASSAAAAKACKADAPPIWDRVSNKIREVHERHRNGQGMTYVDPDLTKSLAGPNVLCDPPRPGVMCSPRGQVIGLAVVHIFPENNSQDRDPQCVGGDNSVFCDRNGRVIGYALIPNDHDLVAAPAASPNPACVGKGSTVICNKNGQVIGLVLDPLQEWNKPSSAGGMPECLADDPSVICEGGRVIGVAFGQPLETVTLQWVVSAQQLAAMTDPNTAAAVVTRGLVVEDLVWPK